MPFSHIRFASYHVSQRKMHADREQAERENTHEHCRTDLAPAPLPNRDAEAGRRQRDDGSAERRQRQGAFARECHPERRRRYQERQAERLDEFVPLQSERLKVGHQGQHEHAGQYREPVTAPTTGASHHSVCRGTLSRGDTIDISA
jgi:hypothetical protein